MPPRGPARRRRRFINAVMGTNIYGQPIFGGPEMPGTSQAMLDYFQTNPGALAQASRIFSRSRTGDYLSDFSGAGSIQNRILERDPAAKQAYLASLGKGIVVNEAGDPIRVLPLGTSLSAGQSFAPQYEPPALGRDGGRVVRNQPAPGLDPTDRFRGPDFRMPRSGQRGPGMFNRRRNMRRRGSLGRYGF